MSDKEQNRKKIIREFSRWAAKSSVRNAPKDFQKDKLTAKLTLIGAELDKLYEKSNVRSEDFKKWHEETVNLVAKSNKVGWAAKLINMMLKVEVYFDQTAHSGLKTYLHPPIDSKLIKNVKDALEEKYKNSPEYSEISNKLKKFKRIKCINKATYAAIIEGLEEASVLLGMSTVFEIESLWEP